MVATTGLDPGTPGGQRHAVRQKLRRVGPQAGGTQSRVDRRSHPQMGPSNPYAGVQRRRDNGSSNGHHSCSSQQSPK